MGGILAPRKLRDDLAARRARGESVAPKPKLKFGEAVDSWLDGPVLDLRETTQAKYRTIVNEHLRARFGARRLDAIVADDLARLVREMRTEGKSEATIAVVLGVVGQIYKFAGRRLGWKGTIPTTLMLPSERPKVSLAKRRPIFTGEQLEQTIAAAHEPFRTQQVCLIRLRSTRCPISARRPVTFSALRASNTPKLGFDAICSTARAVWDSACSYKLRTCSSGPGVLASAM